MLGISVAGALFCGAASSCGAGAAPATSFCGAGSAAVAFSCGTALVEAPSLGDGLRDELSDALVLGSAVASWAAIAGTPIVVRAMERSSMTPVRSIARYRVITEDRLPPRGIRCDVSTGP